MNELAKVIIIEKCKNCLLYDWDNDECNYYDNLRAFNDFLNDTKPIEYKLKKNNIM